MRATDAPQVLTVVRTAAYGRWRATVRAGAHEVEAYGLTPEQAEYRALLRAREREETER